MRRSIAPWARIKRKSPGQPIVYREKSKNRSGVLFAFVLVAAIILLTTLRIPERLGMINEPTEQNVTPALELTGVYKPLLAEILDMEQEADWDGDGRKNGADLYPRDIDADRNGVSDGYEGKTFISGELPIKYRNVKLVASNSQSGVVWFRGDYYISSYAGWVAFEGENGSPYVFRDGQWKSTDFERIENTCYISISGTCRIRFSDDGKPEDRDVILDAVPAVFENRPDDRYAIANAPLTQLEQIYSSVDNGETVQISIIAEAGEQLLLVHGYDKLGNLIVSKCDSLSEAGKILITVKSQIFWDGQRITMRSWFEFECGELSSYNGDVLTIF